MKTVWKYPIPLADDVLIEIQEGAQLLTVGVQDSKMYLWALVNPLARKTQRGLRIVGTGHEIEHTDGLRYVGTVQIPSSGMVWHFFDEE